MSYSNSLFFRTVYFMTLTMYESLIYADSPLQDAVLEYRVNRLHVNA